MFPVRRMFSMCFLCFCLPCVFCINLLYRQGLDWFGGTQPRDALLQRAMAHEDANPEARIVVLSDVWLDKDATLKRLETILDGVPGNCALTTATTQPHRLRGR